MRFAARFLVTFLTLLMLLIPSASVFAQSTTPKTSQTQFPQTTTEDVPQNLHNYTQNVLLEIVSAFSCQMVGVDPVDKQRECLGVNQQTGEIGFVKNGGGLIGVTTHLIGMLYTPPAHLSDYTRYIAGNFGIAKSAQAQTTGIESISPLAKAWSVFRNLVYIIFVLVFLIIGVAIMLRVRIDPRTVMTIQNQIPKLIVGLILVTFSFAIAGLLIDLMWLFTYILINVMSSASSTSVANIMSNLNTNPVIFAHNVLGGLNTIAVNSSAAITGLVVNLFSSGGNAPAPTSSLVDLITNAIGALVGLVLSLLLGAIVGILAFFIISIALLWGLLRLWFALLQAYIAILIDIVLAPFWIVAGLLPGAGPKVGVVAWLRDIIANLAAFPAAVLMFMLGNLFIESFGSSFTQGQFTPPLIGNPQDTSALGALIGLGIILATPSVVKMVREALKAPGLPLGPVSQNLGVGQSVVGGFVGGSAGNLFRRDQYGRAVGRGALWTDLHVRHPVVRNLMGWNQQSPDEIRQEIEARKGNPKTTPQSPKAKTEADEEDLGHS